MRNQTRPSIAKLFAALAAIAVLIFIAMFLAGPLVGPPPTAPAPATLDAASPAHSPITEPPPITASTLEPAANALPQSAPIENTPHETPASNAPIETAPPPAEPPTIGPGELLVIVRDEAGHPIAGASVSLAQVAESAGSGGIREFVREATDAVGFAIVKRPNSGDYDVSVRADGFAWNRVPARVAISESAPLQIECVMTAEARISGRIVDAHTGQPIEVVVDSAAITTHFARSLAPTDARRLIGGIWAASDENKNAAGFMVGTDAAGLFIIDHAPIGDLRLTVDVAGYRLFSREITVGGGGHTIDVGMIELHRQPRVNLIAIDDKGRPLPGVKIFAKLRSTFRNLATHRDADWVTGGDGTVFLGYSVLERAGDVRFEFVCEDHALAQIEWPSKARRETANELWIRAVFTSAGRLLGYLTAIDIEPSRLRLTARKVDGDLPDNAPDPRAKVANDGRFDFGNVFAGRYRVEGFDAESGIFFGTAGVIDVPAGNTQAAALTIALNRENLPALTGTLRFADGSPVVGAAVVSATAGFPPLQIDFANAATTGADGHFRLHWRIRNAEQMLLVRLPSGRVLEFYFEFSGELSQHLDLRVPSDPLHVEIRSHAGPMAGARVTVSLKVKSNFRPQRMQQTDADGRCQFDFLQDGDYDVRVMCAGFVPASQSLGFPTDGAHMVIVLRPADGRVRFAFDGEWAVTHANRLIRFSAVSRDSGHKTQRPISLSAPIANGLIAGEFYEFTFTAADGEKVTVSGAAQPPEVAVEDLPAIAVPFPNAD